MTPEDQQTAIAKLCLGIAYIDHKGVPRWLTRGSYDGSACFIDDIFDPLNDLNAMHEAEKVLTRAQRERYRTELVYRHAGGDVFATAAQRAEAFLRVLGLLKR